VYPRAFMTLRVAQFSLKIAHLSFSMGPRGPRAYGLLPRLWILTNLSITDMYAVEFFVGSEFSQRVLSDYPTIHAAGSSLTSSQIFSRLSLPTFLSVNNAQLCPKVVTPKTSKNY